MSASTTPSEAHQNGNTNGSAPAEASTGMEQPRGYLIVFEGPDRCGKTTQTARFVEHLRSRGVSVAEGSPWRFPDRTTPTGKMIDSYLQSDDVLDDRAVHLLFCANRWEKASALRAALAAGQTVVLDRYAYSGIAYSAAKGLDARWCRQADTGLPRPDVVLYLDLPVEVARTRPGFGAEKFEKAEFQQRVGQQFKELFGALPYFKIVNANQSMDMVFQTIVDTANAALPSDPSVAVKSIEDF